MRKIVVRAFSLSYLTASCRDIGAVSEDFVSSLCKLDGQEVDMWSITKACTPTFIITLIFVSAYPCPVQCCTMDIIGRTAFGHDFSCSKSLQSSPVAEAFEHLLDDFTQRSFNNILHPAHLFYWLPTARNRLHRKNFAVVRDAIGDILSKRKELRERDRSLEHHDILKYMLDAFEEQNIAADAATLSDNLVTMLFAGYDTSSITLTYAFYLMARHPDVAARCRQEVISAIGTTAHASFNDVQSLLPLCTAVINETLRLYPPAPVTVRYTEAPVELMPGIVVPPGSVRLFY
jgi:cytochrome P450